MKEVHGLKVLTGLVMVVLVFSLTACDVFSGTSAEPTPMVEVPPVVQAGVVKAEGNIVPVDYTSLGFPMTGEVVEILVEEGDEVKAGDVLARLGEREQMDAAVSAAELELQAAQKALDDLTRYGDLEASSAWVALVEAEKAVIEAEQVLDDLDTDSYRDEIDDARIKVEDIEEELEDAQDELDKYIDLDEDNPTRVRAEDDLEDVELKYEDALYELDLLVNALDLAKANLKLAQDRLADAQIEYDMNGPDPADVSLAEARVANAEKQIEAAKANLDKLELVALIDGTVVELDLELNQQVTAFQPVVMIVDMSTWYVDTNDLTEMEVVDVSVGQAVTLVPDALPDLELTGVVESIDDMFNEKYGDITYTVRIALDEVDPQLRWGMTVAVDFEK